MNTILFYIPQKSEHHFHHMISCPLEHLNGAAGKVAPPAGQHLGECLEMINMDHHEHPQGQLQGHDNECQSNIFFLATTLT